MTLTPPQMMLNATGVTAILRDMEFYCEGAVAPGYQIQTMGVRRYTFGPEEKRPFAPVFTPVQATFNADAKGEVLGFWNAWLQFIMAHDWYQGGIRQKSNFGGGDQYYLAYKEDLATDITIKVFDTAGNVTVTYILKEAFPSQVTDVPLNWSDVNTTTKFMVNLEYLDWTTTTLGPSSIDASGNPISTNYLYTSK